MTKKYTLFTAFSAWFLIFAGALVTSTGSGLSVPDWPLSFGQFFPEMKGGVLYEHGHRLIAGFVALLTFGLLFIVPRSSRVAYRLSISACVMVVLQATLGGLTVLFLLPTFVSVGHACLGQLFFVVLCLVAYLVHQDNKPNFQGESIFPIGMMVFVGLIFVQLFLGAWMRHIGAGLVIPDFPLNYGKWIPPFFSYAVAIAFSHRVGALLILIGSFFVFVALRKYKTIFKGLTYGFPMLIALQITLGAYTIWSGKNAWIASIHVLIGALIFALASIIMVRAHQHLDSSKTKKWIKDVFDLGKPKITLFVCITAACAFYLASTNGVSIFNLIISIFSIFLVSFGSCAINQVMEIQIDKKMDRTKHRPLPENRVSVRFVWIFSVCISLLGLLLMAVLVNFQAAFWLALAWIGYVVLYTPLKVRTPFNTIVGAVPGALPPVVGWVAARGHLSYEAWILFLIMFFWQLPHFLSIAWLYKEDYIKADVKMLTGMDEKGEMTARQSLLYTVALFPVIMLPFVFSMAGYLYLTLTIILTILFIKASFLFYKSVGRTNAKVLLLASVIYLPALFVIMIVDKIG